MVKNIWEEREVHGLPKERCELHSDADNGYYKQYGETIIQQSSPLTFVHHCLALTFSCIFHVLNHA